MTDQDIAYIIRVLELIAFNTSVDHYAIKNTKTQLGFAHREAYGTQQPSYEELQKVFSTLERETNDEQGNS